MLFGVQIAARCGQTASMDRKRCCFESSQLNVNVLEVSAEELKQKKKNSLDSCSVQQLVLRLLTLSFSLQFIEASAASQSLARDWTRVQGRERTSATSR